jgi:hypothetical protein
MRLTHLAMGIPADRISLDIPAAEGSAGVWNSGGSRLGGSACASPAGGSDRAPEAHRRLGPHLFGHCAGRNDPVTRSRPSCPNQLSLSPAAPPTLPLRITRIGAIMTRLTLELPPVVLAERLAHQLQPLLEQLGWQHDDLALHLHDAADRLIGYTAAATAPIDPSLRARYRSRALAAARDLHHRLNLLQRLHLPNTPTATPRAHLRLVSRALGRSVPPLPHTGTDQPFIPDRAASPCGEHSEPLRA